MIFKIIKSDIMKKVIIETEKGTIELELFKINW